MLYVILDYLRSYMEYDLKSYILKYVFEKIYIEEHIWKCEQTVLGS